MNTDEVVKYLNYQGPIFVKKIRFETKEDDCKCPKKRQPNELNKKKLK